MAIGEDNEEYIKAGQLGIERKRVFEVLGELSKNKFMIAVSGMHGKSTTTAMLGLVMEKAGFDPTVFVGTKIGSHFQEFISAGVSKFWHNFLKNFLPYLQDKVRKLFKKFYSKFGNFATKTTLETDFR